MRALRRLLRGPQFVVTLYAGVAALLVAVAAEFVRNGLAGVTANSPLFLGFLTIFVLALGAGQLAALRDSVERLSDKSRFSIQFYDDHRELHHQAARVIRRAPRNAQIFAVNSYVEVFSNGTGAADPAQQEYLREFERRFRELTYHRLIQVPEGGATVPLARRVTPAYLEHYRRMVGCGHPGVKLEEVKASIPTSFVLAKHDRGGEVVWQIHRHHPDHPDEPDRVQMLGIFVIRDPDGIVVPRFMEWFRIIDSEQAHRVSADQLAG